VFMGLPPRILPAIGAKLVDYSVQAGLLHLSRQCPACKPELACPIVHLNCTCPPVPEPVSCEGSPLTLVFILGVALFCAVAGCGCGVLAATFGRRCLGRVAGGVVSTHSGVHPVQAAITNPIAAAEDLRGEAQRQFRLVRTRDGASR